jgi:hypothetical protein
MFSANWISLSWFLKVVAPIPEKSPLSACILSLNWRPYLRLGPTLCAAPKFFIRRNGFALM